MAVADDDEVEDEEGDDDEAEGGSTGGRTTTAPPSRADGRAPKGISSAHSRVERSKTKISSKTMLLAAPNRTNNCRERAKEKRRENRIKEGINDDRLTNEWMDE